MVCFIDPLCVQKGAEVLIYVPCFYMHIAFTPQETISTAVWTFVCALGPCVILVNSFLTTGGHECV